MDGHGDTEQVLLDSGPVPLIVRLLTLPAIVLLTWILAVAIGERFGIRVPGPTGKFTVHPIVGIAVMLLLDAFFVSMWFIRSWILYDTRGHALLIRQRLTCGTWDRRIPIDEIVSIEIRSGPNVIGRTWKMSAIRTDGESVPLTRTSLGEGDARSTAERIAHAIGKPVKM